MRIETGLSSSSLLNQNAAKVGGNGPFTPAQAPKKSIGEAPPIPLPLAAIPVEIQEMFAPGGIVARHRRRLNRLKNKKCVVIPAKGTVACINQNDEVFLGVEFLQEFAKHEDVIAGVMAHEWGHACAEKPEDQDLQQMTWEELMELRRAHETLADEMSGRLLALMGYKPDGLIRFLLRSKTKTHNLKYHDVETRSRIVRVGFEDEVKKISFAREIFPKTVYANHYHSTIIDDEI